MPSFTMIPMAEARPQASTGKRALLLKEYQSFIDRLGPRQAARLTPEGGETAAAVRRRIGAAAKLSGVQLTIKRIDDAVYFWKVPRRGRPRRATAR